MHGSRVPTELVESADSTDVAQDGCFVVTSSISPGLHPGIGHVWADNHLEFNVASPDGATSVAVHMGLKSTAPFQSGQDTVVAAGAGHAAKSPPGTRSKPFARGAQPDTQVGLFVYYSGHADADALHFGTSRLEPRGARADSSRILCAFGRSHRASPGP
jgi:hypothetical protein